MPSKSIQSVGIDVSKAKLDICFLYNKGETILFQVTNNKKGISSLIKKMIQKKVGEQVPIIIESTGDYHLLSAVYLTKAGYTVKEINPIITKQFVSATIRGTKTDKLDAYNLSLIGIMYENLQDFNRSINMIELGKKISLIASLEKKIASLNLMMKNYSKTAQKLGFDTSEMIDGIKETIIVLGKQIKLLQNEIESHSFTDEESNDIDRISSVIGISRYMGTVFYIKFANKSFESKESMFAFVGLDPKIKDSGNMIGRRKISKRGSPYVRKKLFQAAFCSVQHSKLFADIYNKHKNNGKHHFTCLIAIAKKMIHIIWSMMKNKTYFREDFRYSI